MSDIRIAIADDHSLFREGMRMIIAGMQGIRICLEAETGKELLEKLESNPVDIILLDIEMREMTGVEALKRLTANEKRPGIIMLSMHTEARMISYMMEQGASAYLPKDVRSEELETAIRTVYEKGLYLNDMISKSLLSGLKNKSNKHTPVVQLSSREKEILELICQEMTAREIGEKLFISERTVEGHRKNLYMKLEVKNSAGLVKKALQLNLLEK